MGLLLDAGTFGQTAVGSDVGVAFNDSVLVRGKVTTGILDVFFGEHQLKVAGVTVDFLVAFQLALALARAFGTTLVDYKDAVIHSGKHFVELFGSRSERVHVEC